MINFIVDPAKDLLHIIDRRDREDDKKYKLSEIALIRIEYYDDTETDGYICIYLKSEITKVYRELPLLVLMKIIGNQYLRYVSHTIIKSIYPVIANGCTAAIRPL